MIKNGSRIEVAVGDVSLAAETVTEPIQHGPEAPLELALQREHEQSPVSDGEEDRRVAAADGHADDLLGPPRRRVVAEEHLGCWLLRGVRVRRRDLHDLVLCH